jgi:asparagine N-glycosylation enzyme membrane subunit Stt3
VFARQLDDSRNSYSTSGLFRWNACTTAAALQRKMMQDKRVKWWDILYWTRMNINARGKYSMTPSAPIL